MYWFYYFVISFLICSFVQLVFVGSNKRGKHSFWKRLGGIGIITAFVFTVVFNPEVEMTLRIFGFILLSGLIGLFGLLDDFFDLSWNKQLVFQIFIAFSIFFFGAQIEGLAIFDGNSFLDFKIFSVDVLGEKIFLASLCLTVFWIILVMNAVNWSDGVDGLAGGIGIIGGLAIFFVSLIEEVNQPAIAILALILLGSLLSFWFFNFPPGKIEAGTAGSYFIGFSLAVLAIIAGTKLATVMLVLVVPVVDFFWVIGERFSQGVSIFSHEKNSRHLHYKLRKLNWSDRKILFIYLFFTGLVLTSSFFVPREVKVGMLVGEIFVVIWFMWLVGRKLKVHKVKSW